MRARAIRATLAYRSAACGALYVVLVAVFSACAKPPSIRDLSPGGAEALRAGLARVGVQTDTDRVKLTFRRPAKGVWGGATRGAAIGAAAPIVIGAVIPLPGTTFLGALLSPFTAFGGMLYGAMVAPPRAQVQSAEESIARALAAVEKTRPRLRLRDRIVELGRERTGLTFIALDGSRADDVDTVLDLTDQRAGLEGAWRIDPPSIRGDACPSTRAGG